MQVVASEYRKATGIQNMVLRKVFVLEDSRGCSDSSEGKL